MSATELKLPEGIAANNPGSLHERIGDRGVIELRKSIAVYRTMLDGTIALAETCHVYYAQHNCHTVRTFVQRFATMDNVNLLEWEMLLCRWLRIDQKDADVKDIRLDNSWQAIDTMRAITFIMQGRPPPQYSIGGEWIGAETYANALRFIGNWAKL
jgi:hypothetical protein